MLIPTGFIGRAKRLDDIDLPTIGYQIAVGEDEIHALMDVEAPGSGFDTLGRPKALFEPHKFYSILGSGVLRNKAVSQGLAYPRWGTRPYPKDSYARIRAAMAISESAALRATSWGRSQVLGDNHLDLGYDTVQEMVAAFCDDEENHIQGMVDFIKANHIDDDLRAHRWEVVARVYNGPGYKTNKYDTRLAAAFDKWKRIRDTPFNPKDIKA